MSIERLVENLGEQSDRRRFLRRIGTTALAVAGGMAVFPRSAKALDSCAQFGFCPPCSGGLYHYQCCCLAEAPSSCSCSQPWCWGCCGNCLTGERWACCECDTCSFAYIYDYSCTRCEGPS